MPEQPDDYGARLRELEQEILAVLDLVAIQLTRAVDAVTKQDLELATIVIEADQEVDRTYGVLHAAILELMAERGPRDSDLRMIASALQITRCIERIGDQCVNIAKLVPLAGTGALRDPVILATIGEMGTRAHAQIGQVKEALGARHASLAQAIAAADERLRQLDRRLFRRAVDIGDDTDVREWAMFMILAARALERIGGNTVEIGDHLAYIVTGRYKGDELHPASGR